MSNDKLIDSLLIALFHKNKPAISITRQIIMAQPAISITRQITMAHIKVHPVKPYYLPLSEWNITFNSCSHKRCYTKVLNDGIHTNCQSHLLHWDSIKWKFIIKSQTTGSEAYLEIAGIFCWMNRRMGLIGFISISWSWPSFQQCIGKTYREKTFPQSFKIMLPKQSKV